MKNTLKPTPNSSGEGLPAAEVGNPLEKNSDFIPAPEEVAKRAYFLYLAGGAPEQDLSHWLMAEKQLIAERATQKNHGLHN